MGFAGKWEEKLKAQELRRKGYSYNEILKDVPVSKSTISNWCKDIVLTPRQIKKLYQSQMSGQHRGSVTAARNKQERRFKEREKLRQQGIEDIGELNERERFLLGVALYAGDGGKYDDRNIGFSNSNPRLIEFMMRWLRKSCGVAEEKFRGAIWIHDNLDEGKAKRFWSDLTGIPIDQFHKSYIVKNKKNSKKIRKKKHENGVFSVRVSDTRLKRRLLGWLDGILSAT